MWYKWLPLPTEGQLDEEGEKYFYHICMRILGFQESVTHKIFVYDDNYITQIIKQ